MDGASPDVSGDACANPSSVFRGTLEIWSAGDLAAASAYRCVEGTVQINPGFLGTTKIRLPGIEVVSKSFIVAGDQHLEELDFPDLRIVGYAAEFGSASYPLPALRALAVPSLQRVGALLNVSGTGLSEITFPSLTTTDELLTVTHNSKLTRLSVPSLTKVEFVTIADNTTLPQCQVDGLFATLVSNGAAAAHLHTGHLLGLEPSQQMEGDLALGVFMEDAIEEDRMHVRVESQVTRCPLHDEHGSALPRDTILRCEPSPVECKHCVGELPYHRAEKLSVEPEATSPREGHRQHPLTQRDLRHHVVHEIRCPRTHLPSQARRAEPAALTGKRDKPRLRAPVAAQPREAPTEPTKQSNFTSSVVNEFYVR